MREKKKPKKRILCAIISCSLLASIGFAQPASAADTAVDTPAVQDDIETMSYSDGTSTGTSELTGVSLGTGTTVYAKQFINQVDVYNSALNEVVKWRRDALNDKQVTFGVYNWQTKQTDYYSVSDYLKKLGISENEYLTPKWSNALERIAIQRAIEAYSAEDAHTRPNGESCFRASYNKIQSEAEILAWGHANISGAIDLWAEEKKDYVQNTGAEVGHYLTLINPNYEYYGFAAGDGQYYRTTFSGEAGTRSSAAEYSDSTPTNMRGLGQFEVNVDDDDLREGATWNLSSMKSGSTQTAKVTLKHRSGRYEFRGTWGSSNANVISANQSGVYTAGKVGTAKATVSSGSFAFSTDVTVMPLTLKYDGNGATSGYVASQTGSHNDEITVAKNGFSRSGYTFSSWNTKADGTGTSYAPGSKITLPAGDTILYAQWVENPKLTRLAGQTRYDTMATIVQHEQTKQGQTVIIASGENYPDALSASGLAGGLAATIMLVGSNSLPSQTANRLASLKPNRIIIIGGPSAISKNVENALHQYSSTVTRYYGEDRYETSLAVFKAGQKLGVEWNSTALMATGDNYADALSASSLAYAQKMPIFLCSSASGFSSSQLDAINKTIKQGLVIGGTSAIPNWIVNSQLQQQQGISTKRIAGATRYETSIEIAKSAERYGLTAEGSVFATGANFPDALAAGPLAGKKNGFLLLADPFGTTAQFVQKYKNQVKTAYVVGGEQAVSSTTANQIADSLGLRHP